jgi:hypothetical protein
VSPCGMMGGINDRGLRTTLGPTDSCSGSHELFSQNFLFVLPRTQTRTFTNLDDTEANAAGKRRGTSRTLCKQSKYDKFQES